MKTLKKLFFFFIAVTLLTGCFKVETTVKITKDGSGKIYQTILMSKTLVDMISQFAGSFERFNKQRGIFTYLMKKNLRNLQKILAPVCNTSVVNS